MTLKSTIRTGLLATTLIAGAAFAQANFVADTIDSLRQQGYIHFDLSRTFFGRIRIDALSENSARQIILNRHTGEILRNVDMTARMAEMMADHSFDQEIHGMEEMGMGTGSPGRMMNPGNPGSGMGSGGNSGGMGGSGGNSGGMGGGSGGMGGN